MIPRFETQQQLRDREHIEILSQSPSNSANSRSVLRHGVDLQTGQSCMLKISSRTGHELAMWSQLVRIDGSNTGAQHGVEKTKQPDPSEVGLEGAGEHMNREEHVDHLDELVPIRPVAMRRQMLALVMPLYKGSVSNRQYLYSNNPPSCLRLAKRVHSALAAMHARGWCHMDVKPSNILAGRGGLEYLSDYGAAARIHDPVHELTPQYYPMDGGQTAAPATDFLMLALTVVRMLGHETRFRPMTSLQITQHIDSTPDEPIRCFLRSICAPLPIFQ